MNNNFNLAIGTRIRQVREMLSLTREKFSEKCNISTSFLADVEHGKKGISTETLYKICTGVNISPTYIVLGTDSSGDVTAITELLSQLEPKHIESAVEILRAFVKAINTE